MRENLSKIRGCSPVLGYDENVMTVWRGYLHCLWIDVLINLTVCLLPTRRWEVKELHRLVCWPQWNMKMTFRKGTILWTSIDHWTAFLRGRLSGRRERAAFSQAIEDTASPCYEGARRVHIAVQCAPSLLHNGSLSRIWSAESRCANSQSHLGAEQRVDQMVSCNSTGTGELLLWVFTICC